MIARRTLLGAGLAAPFIIASRALAASSGETLTIAVLPGLGYAPLTLAKVGGWIENAVPGLKVNWLQIASSAAIREGMLSRDIDAGAGSVAPFLIGRRRGFKVGLISAMTVMDLLLLTNDPAIKSLNDFDPSKKIAVTAPDTNQAFILRWQHSSNSTTRGRSTGASWRCRTRTRCRRCSQDIWVRRRSRTKP